MLIVGELEGSVMVLPPLILKLLPEILKVGLGTSMVVEFTPFVTDAIPVVETVCDTCAGTFKVNEFPEVV